MASARQWERSRQRATAWRSSSLEPAHPMALGVRGGDRTAAERSTGRPADPRKAEATESDRGSMLRRQHDNGDDGAVEQGESHHCDDALVEQVGDWESWAPRVLEITEREKRKRRKPGGAENGQWGNHLSLSPNPPPPPPLATPTQPFPLSPLLFFPCAFVSHIIITTMLPARSPSSPCGGGGGSSTSTSSSATGRSPNGGDELQMTERKRERHTRTHTPP